MLRTAGLLAFLSEGVVSGLHRPDFAGFVASVPLSYPAAGTLPGPDFHRQAKRSFVWAHMSAFVGTTGICVGQDGGSCGVQAYSQVVSITTDF